MSASLLLTGAGVSAWVGHHTWQAHPAMLRNAAVQSPEESARRTAASALVTDILSNLAVLEHLAEGDDEAAQAARRGLEHLRRLLGR